jgi:hypothetical protein
MVASSWLINDAASQSPMVQGIRQIDIPSLTEAIKQLTYSQPRHSKTPIDGRQGWNMLAEQIERLTTHLCDTDRL